MRRPRRRGYEGAAGVRLVHRQFHIGTAGLSNIGGNSGITTARFPANDPGGRQDLRAMAYGSDRFAGIGEVPDDFEHSGVEAYIFGRPAARDDQRIVILRTHIVERGVQSEIVAAFLAVSLIAFEIVYRCAHLIARSLVRTDGMDDVPDHQQSLKWHHYFVVFDVIADKHE